MVLETVEEFLSTESLIKRNRHRRTRRGVINTERKKEKMENEEHGSEAFVSARKYPA